MVHGIFFPFLHFENLFSRSRHLFRNAPHITCDDSALNFLCSITSARLARYANGKVESIKGLTSQRSRPVALAQWQEKKDTGILSGAAVLTCPPKQQASWNAALSLRLIFTVAISNFTKL